MKTLRRIWGALYERLKQKAWAHTIIAKVSRGMTWYFSTFQGKRPNRIAGNSVAAQMLILNHLLPECENYGIPGDQSIGLEFRFGSILSNGAKRIAVDIGGNDLDANVPVKEIVERIFRMAERAHSAGALFAWIEPPALGPQHRKWSEKVSDLIAAVDSENLRRKTKGLRAIHIVRVRRAMAGPDGFVKPEYYGDGIHPSALCFGDVYFHELNSFFMQPV